MRKRLIALLLSLMMTLVLLPASFAEEDPAAENPEPAESLEPAEGLRAGNVSIDSTNFPDDNFRNYVINNHAILRICRALSCLQTSKL